MAEMRNFFTRWFSRRSGFVLFDDLTAADFREHKIWLDVHLHDFGNGRYAEVDDETFRPWDSSYPASHAFSGLVAAGFTTRSGMALFGYISIIEGQESKTGDSIVSRQPEVFVPGGRVSFWHGDVYQFGRETLDGSIAQLQNATGAALDQVFPVEYQTVSDAVSPRIAGAIEGFGYFSAENVIAFENGSAS